MENATATGKRLGYKIVTHIFHFMQHFMIVETNS